MWSYCGKTSGLLKRMPRDEGGVVSFDYVVVAFCLVSAVLAVFGTGAGGAFATGLTNGVNAIGSVIAALGG